MKTKKVKVIASMVGIVIVGVLYLCLFYKNQNFIIGEWKVNAFIFENEKHSYEEIGEYYGIDTVVAYKYFSITFNEDKTASIILPTYQEENPLKVVECDYSINNNVITLVNNDERIEAFQISKGTLLTLDNTFLFEGWVLEKEQ